VARALEGDGACVAVAATFGVGKEAAEVEVVCRHEAEAHALVGAESLEEAVDFEFLKI